MSDPVARVNAALEGRYAIERELGEGGMATVYLADDLKHQRKVALKVLKPELAAVVGAERFLAEITTTANLTHPHILPVFDSGEADGFLFYVMPHIEGESLRERIDREKQLPVDEAVKIATDLAEALDYAHRHKIIHRDIKPANILIHEGRPLITDFGIALAVGVAGGGRLTETGLSLGTPHYMSPGQATGDQNVGPQTDTYALGCVLYEMLVGEPPYTGPTAQAVLGQIIAGETASATKKRASVPANVDAALRCSLEKLPADRFASTQEFGKALGDEHFRYGELATAGESAAVGPWNRLTMTFATLAALFAVAFGWALLRPETPPPLARFSSPFEEGQAPSPGSYGMDLTADGSALVYVGPGPSGEGTQLWIRRWANLDATPIRGTEGAIRTVVLSPDAREVVFVAGDVLRVVPLDGGPSWTLVERGFLNAWDWTSDGFVYFQEATLPFGVVVRVPATGGGGNAVAVTELLEGELAHNFFDVLPGGKMGVFGVLRDLTGEGTEVWAINLETREQTFLTAGNRPRYLTGRLLFVTQDGVLMERPIDPATAKFTGPAVTVEEDLVMRGLGFANYAVSESGTLIYEVGGADAVAGEGLLGVELVWVTRSGGAVPVDPNWRFQVGTGGAGLKLSPDGTRVALTINDDIWTMQLPDGPPEQLTSDDRIETSPFWSRPNGEFVTYTRTDGSGDNEIWKSRADGTGSPQPVLDDERRLYQGQWSHDGEWILVRTITTLAPSPDDDILGFRPGVDSVAIPLVASPEFSERSPALSPNGRWLAYTSDSTGQREVYVVPFPDVDSTDPVPVSRNRGGQNPLWAHSGAELFFVDAQRGLVAAEVEADSVFSVLNYTTLFTLGSEFAVIEGFDLYDIGPDDERFLMLRFAGLGGETGGGTGFIWVQNRFTELRERESN